MDTNTPNNTDTAARDMDATPGWLLVLLLVLLRLAVKACRVRKTMAAEAVPSDRLTAPRPVKPACRAALPRSLGRWRTRMRFQRGTLRARSAQIRKLHTDVHAKTDAVNDNGYDVMSMVFFSTTVLMDASEVHAATRRLVCLSVCVCVRE